MQANHVQSFLNVQVIMQADSIASRRSSPVRNGAHAAASTRVTLQKHQQALRSCLELCDSLGFHCENQESTSQSQAPQQVCQLVDAATQYFIAQKDSAVKQNAGLFGSLLDFNDMQATVNLIHQFFHTVSFHFLSAIYPS